MIAQTTYGINLSAEEPDWRKIGTGPEVIGPETFYKGEGTDKGPFASLFSTTGINTPTATIEYLGTDALSIDSVWVKGGRSLIFFDLSANPWDGLSNLVVSNLYLWQEGGPPPSSVITEFPTLALDSSPPAISHVSIDGEFTSVPDTGSTLALLGLGLGLLGFLKRRK